MSGKNRGYAFDVDAWVQFHLLRLATFHPDTTKADLAVLAEIIQRYWGKYGNGWVTHEHLSSIAGISLPTVKRAKKNLVKLGFVTVVQAGRRGSATVYKPNFDLVPQKGITDDTETNGITDDTKTVGLGITDDTETGVFGITDEPPTYLHDRPTRAGSQIDRIDPAPASPPLSVGLAATGADGAGEMFEELYRIYDNRQKKAEAKAEYMKLEPSPELHTHMMEAAHRWHASWAAQGKADAPRFTLGKWIEREEFDCDPPTTYKPKERKASTKPTPKPKPVPENDNYDEVVDESPMVNDVGMFSPFGRYVATIVGSDVTQLDLNTQRVVLRLKWSDHFEGHDVEHTFYYEHADPAIQDRGQKFVRALADCLDIDDLNDTEQLHGRRITATINNKLAISYSRAAA